MYKYIVIDILIKQVLSIYKSSETEKKNGNVSNKKWRVTKPQQDKETDEYLKRNVT